MSASKQTYYDYQVQQNDYSGSEWQVLYEAEQLDMEYRQWQTEQAIKEKQEAQQAAIVQADAPTFMECLVASHNAVSSTLSELTTLLLNVGSSYLRHDIHRIATNLVNKSGLQDEVKENYRQMIDAANVSSQQFFTNNMAAA